MRNPWLSAAIACAMLGATPALAQAPAASAAAILAEADRGLAEDFLKAVNGDAAAKAAFLSQRMSPTARMPKEAFPKVLEAVARTSGGLTLKTATRRGEFVRLIVSSAKGRTGRIDLHLSSAHPGRLDGVLTVPMPTPYDGPLTAASRADLAAAIERRVRFSAERDDFSGAVLVTKGDEVIYAGAFGLADKAAGKAVTPDTRFNLGSMDKQFTAVAIGQLVEQGKLSLDARLIDLLPDYPNREAAAKITVRHLLSHSAGLGMLFERPGWRWKLRYSTMAELLPLFAGEPLEFEPGTRGAYSNEGYVVLGAIVERVSGESWYDYVQAQIFAPAGMTHTAYLTDDPTIADRAVGYRFGDDDPLGFGARTANWDTLSWRGNSCGGGFSTAGDMVKFLNALRNGKLLKPQTLALFTAQTPNGYPDYGLGLKRVSTQAGKLIVGHDGGGPGSGVNSDAKMVWETGYAYAVLGNYDGPFAQSLGRDIGEMLAAQD